MSWLRLGLGIAGRAEKWLRKNAGSLVGQAALALAISAMTVGVYSAYRVPRTEIIIHDEVLSRAEKERLYSGTVLVTAHRGGGHARWMGEHTRGTGVVVRSTPDYSLVLTARHIVMGALVVSCSQAGGEEVVSTWARWGVDDDWALLRTEKPVGEPVRILTDWQFSRWERVVSMGHALGLAEPTLTYGEVQAMEHGLIRHTALTVFGNSGGGLYAVVDGRAWLIGITIRVYLVGIDGPRAAVTHLGLSLPLSDIDRDGGLRWPE